MDTLIVSPPAFQEVVAEINRYDPDYEPGNAEANWHNVYSLGLYLFELQLTYHSLHGSSCSADFDFELYNDSVTAIAPFQTDLLIPDTPYSDPYEHLFPDEDAYRLAQTSYATYLSIGGTLSFLDWLARVFWGDEGEGQLPGSTDGAPPQPPDFIAAFEQYEQDGGTLEFHDWWTNVAPGLPGVTIQQLHDFAQQNDWYSPNDSSAILYPPYNGHLNGWFEPVLLPPGSTIDRYGHLNGSFFGEIGSGIPGRALPPDVDTSTGTHTIQVERELPVLQGIAAEWFGEPGGAVQYEINWQAIADEDGVDISEILGYLTGRVQYLADNGWITIL